MTTAFHLRDSFTQYDEDEFEGMPLVVDAGRLRWRIGVAGEEEPRCVTQNLTPWVLSPVLCAAVRASSLAPELEVLSQDCATSRAELWPDDGDDGKGSRASCDGRLGLPALAAEGKTCRDFAAELIELAVRGARGAAGVLWDCNCAMLQHALGAEPRWPGLGLTSGRMQLIVGIPCLQDPCSSHFVREMQRVAFADSGPICLAGYHCDRLVLQPQELLAVYASGRTTALSVNLGVELSCLAVFEGYSLPECARRQAWCAKEVPDAALVAKMIADAIFAAPIDVRADLMSNILISGTDTKLSGLHVSTLHSRPEDWPLQNAVYEALRTEADRRIGVALGEKVPIWRARHWERSEGQGCFFLDHDPRTIDASGRCAFPDRCVRSLVKIISPPERAYSCWIGGSILGSIDRGSRSPALMHPKSRKGLDQSQETWMESWLADVLVRPCSKSALWAARQRLAFACSFFASEPQPETAPEPAPELALGLEEGTLLVVTLSWDLIVEIGEAHLARMAMEMILPAAGLQLDEELVAMRSNPELCWQTPENQQRIIRAPDDSPDWLHEWDGDDLGEGNSWLEIWQRMARADNGVVELHRPPSPLQWLSAEAGLRLESQAVNQVSGVEGAPLSEPMRCVVWLLYGKNWSGNLNWSTGHSDDS